MKRGICRSCEAKLEGAPSFCRRCGEPTDHATVEERRQHDLEKWRRHRQGADASDRPAPRIPAVVGSPSNRRAAPAEMPGHRYAPAHEPARRSKREDVARPARQRRRVPRAKTRAPRARIRDRVPRTVEAKRWAFTLPRRRPRVIDLGPDDPFAYRACVSCERTDWLIRTGRNEDSSWRYWCVRCSRSFKTDVRLAHAVKPFAVAATIMLSLLAFAGLH